MAFTLPQARRILDDSLRGTVGLNSLAVLTDAEMADLGLDHAIAVGIVRVAAAKGFAAPVDDLTAPTDEEVAAVPDAYRLAVRDVMHLERLRWLRGNWTSVTAKVDVLQENSSDLLDSLMKAIAAQEKLVKADHGIGGEAEDAAAAAAVPIVYAGRIVGGWRSRWGEL